MRNGLGAMGMAALCRSPHLTALTGITLTANDLDDEAARIMAGCSKLASLRSLWLYGNRIGPEGVKAMAASPHLAGLETLSLNYNPIGDEGARVLLGAFPKLTFLWLSGLDLGEEIKERLRERFVSKTLLC
jgi:hypothetical protein